MKKLDDIPKKNVFKAPDGYFDHLPTIIQARITKKSIQPAHTTLTGFAFVVKYAFPVVVLIAVGIFWLRPGPSIESQLNDIDANQIALYLDEGYDSETHFDSDAGDWTEQELIELETAVYSNMDYPVDQDILDDIDL